MRGEAGVAVVGIRGGGCEHVKERMRFYRPQRLQPITEVVLAVGGNNLSQRLSRTAEIKTATKTTQEDMESLAGFLQQLMPQATVTTLDLLPRSSEGSMFNSRARTIALHIRQTGTRHHHINFIKSFTTINKRPHKRDKTIEKYPSTSAFYIGGDGTHLNQAGYRAVKRITEWAMDGPKEVGRIFRFEEAGWRVNASFKF